MKAPLYFPCTNELLKPLPNKRCYRPNHSVAVAVVFDPVVVAVAVVTVVVVVVVAVVVFSA